MTPPDSLRAASVISIASLLGVLFALGAPESSVGQEDAAPVLTFSRPANGATISEPPFVIQLCFAEPISTRDLHESEDFYRLMAPDGSLLGRLTEFQGDGYGVTIYANTADAETSQGDWRLDYRTSSPDMLASIEGQIVFTVDPDGESLPQATPPRCLESGLTATPGPSPSKTMPPAPTTEPHAASETPTPSGEPTGDDNGDGGGSDALLITLLLIGFVGGVASIAVIGYIARSRRSHEPQAPGPGDEPPV